MLVVGCAGAPSPAVAPAPPTAPAPDPQCTSLRLQSEMLMGQRFLDALSTAPPDPDLEKRAHDLDASFALLCRR